MTLFPTVVVLGYIKVHVSCSYSSDIFPKIKGMINKQFHFRTTLSVLNIKPDNNYVKLWGGFDDSGFSSQGDIFE